MHPLGTVEHVTRSEGQWGVTVCTDSFLLARIRVHRCDMKLMQLLYLLVGAIPAACE